ncbi:MAG: hypothetical protein PUD70_04235 [Firmicutes bacterium]|nr:hypothetical protein [Bacillota bacterium]
MKNRIRKTLDFPGLFPTPATDGEVVFESTTSTIPSHRQIYFQISTPKSFLGKRRAKPEGNSKNDTYSLSKSAAIPREIPHAGGFGEPDFESASSTNSNTPAYMWILV